MDIFRTSLNKVQSTAEFMLDTKTELILYEHAESSSKLDSSVEGGEVLTGEERRALIVHAACQKRSRIEFYHSHLGVKPRLYVMGHVPIVGFVLPLRLVRSEQTFERT